MNKRVCSAKWIVPAIAAVAFAAPAWAANCTSARTGNWSAKATWGTSLTGCIGAPGGIPGANDNVTIAAANPPHTVTVDMNSAARSLTFTGGNRNGTLNLNPGIVLNVTNAVTINRSTSSTAGRNTKSLNVGSGTLTAASISIIGGTAAARVSQVTVSTGTIAVTGSITFTGAAGSGQFISTGASTVNVGGNFGIGAGTGGTFNGGTGTINFNGVAAQTMGAFATYYNVNVNNMAGIVNAEGNTTMMGSLGIGAGSTFASGAFVQTVNGDVTNNGIHTATTGNITLSGGAAAHVLSGNGTYANLVLDDVNGATLAGSPTVSGTLTLTLAGGNITTGANTLITSANCPASMARTSGYVIGNLRLAFPVAAGVTTCIFPIGDNAGYLPVTVALTGVTTAGSLTGRVDGGDHPDTIANISRIDQTNSANHYWTLTPDALLAGGTYGATIQFCAAVPCGVPAERDTLVPTPPATFIVARKGAGIWTRPTVGAIAADTIQTTGGVVSAQGFGEFAVGNPLVGVYRGVNQLIDLREIYW